jgi:hypothetical protein
MASGTPDPAATIRDPLRDALAWWELRRIPYNLALALLAAGWVVVTWPHFRPVFTLESLGKLLVLAALGNVCYCAAYGLELLFAFSDLGPAWRRRRGAVWIAGTLFALLLAQYWIGDEIYPYVN